MTGLTDRAVGQTTDGVGEEIEQARRRWDESMQRQLESLRREVRSRSPAEAAARGGAVGDGAALHLAYWRQAVRVAWPELEPVFEEDGSALPAFDAGMLLYYLRQADGTAPAGRWISFRELPDGGFYHLAYQRYSGDRLAHDFGAEPERFDRAAARLDGAHLPEIGPHAWAFDPLPRIRLAAILWPGDDEFPPRGSILFDASASHYMTTDGLGLLGGGLAGRLAKAHRQPNL